MKFGGIIVAAGQSSRMGEFKPLLPLKGKTIIENTLLSLIDAGIKDICIVTGKNSKEVEKVLEKYTIIIAKNERYGRTDMFESMKIGLKKLLDTDAVFFLPGDYPLVNESTVRRLMEEYENKNVDIIYPTYKGKKGHPPVISKKCYKKILEDNPKDGLKETLSKNNFTSEYFETDDIGTIKDIDYMEDYINILKLK